HDMPLCRGFRTDSPNASHLTRQGCGSSRVRSFHYMPFLSANQGSTTACPSFRVPSCAYVMGSMVSLRTRPDPSPNRKFAPPEWNDLNPQDTFQFCDPSPWAFRVQGQFV